MRPSCVLEVDVERLDATVEEAVRVGAPRALRVLGYGELTLVIGWPTEDPVVAVKRLPPFVDAGRLDAYAGLLERYVEILRERGVSVVHTEVRSHPGPGRSVRAYLVQPLVPRERHLNVILASAWGRAGAGAARVGRRERPPLHRWRGRARCAGVELVGAERRPGATSTSPRRCCATARVASSLTCRCSSSVYPWLTRPVLARIAPGVMAQYHDPRTVLLDFASNLHKEGLDRCVPALLEAANRRLDAAAGRCRRQPLFPPGQAAVGADAAPAARATVPGSAACAAGPTRSCCRHPTATALHDKPRSTPDDRRHDHRATSHQRGGVRADRRAPLSPQGARRSRPSAWTSCRAGARACRVWDLEGRDYINLRSSGGVFNFGHHPRFRGRGADQRRSPSTTWATGCCRPRAVRAAREALARLLPEPLRYSFFTASGAEAVEVACKLARSVTRRPGFVCAEHGYHGHVGFSLAMDDPPLSDRVPAADARDHPDPVRRPRRRRSCSRRRPRPR